MGADGDVTKHSQKLTLPDFSSFGLSAADSGADLPLASLPANANLPLVTPSSGADQNLPLVSLDATGESALPLVTLDKTSESALPLVSFDASAQAPHNLNLNLKSSNVLDADANAAAVMAVNGSSNFGVNVKDGLTHDHDHDHERDATDFNGQEKHVGPLRMVIELAIALVVAFSAVWLLKTYVVQPFEVPSASMEPTISVGDKFLADMLFYKMNGVQKGDIVCFDDKTKPNRVLVKRVIATSGQVVDLQNGHVSVDGVILYEPYTHESPSEPLYPHFLNMEINYPYTVPEGYIWVMGDNRDNSSDSRYFGPIEESAIIGRGILVYWPFEHIAILQ
ncbi:MAG: signal peptidase I [Coriobacteriales bacterium]|nr:signal peptidase I [Coriobacteriales bacterium]